MDEPTAAMAAGVGVLSSRSEADQAGDEHVPWYRREFRVGREVEIEEVHEFSRQLASFIEAGIPIIDSLDIVRQQIRSQAMHRVIGEIQASIQRGASFTSAVDEHPKVFPSFYRAIVKSADYTGRLDEVLAQLASYLERDIAARRQIRSALRYPIIVLGIAALAMVAMVMFVLPKFSNLYRNLGARLPLPTRMLLAFTDFVTGYWWAILLALVLVATLVSLQYGHSRNKMRRDALLLRLPLVGGLVQVVAVERFCRVLAALTRAGVPLPDGIQVAADSTNNAVYQEKLADVREVLVRGGGLSEPMEQAGVFPLPMLQMINVGERTGGLSTQLGKAATYYEREVSFRIKKATDLVEPIVILGVGIIVGFIAVAQVAAMYSVFSQID
jgi:type IV pilus assembly protein PilC